MTRCEAQLGYYPHNRQCGQVVGVHRWVDYFGDTRATCTRHSRQMLRRFGTVKEADRDRAIMEATELRESEDVALAGWTMGELMEAWGK